MIEAVFISDLHLHPQDTGISQRFNYFLQWAKKNVKNVYILGDFFHVWSGDDAMDSWSENIAKQLSMLVEAGITIYFMHGNRDFLLGEHFAKKASITLLSEPTVITLGEENILLVHGDRYCTKDKTHQWLRLLTRNALFPRLFLRLPLAFRQRLVNKVRAHSQGNRTKPARYMDIITEDMLAHMQQLKVNVLIHGHIHKPGLTVHGKGASRQYVLSDWDDIPTVLCYDKANGFYFTRLVENYHA